jgi:hypothetical protein
VIIHQQVLPEGTPIQMLDEVTEEMGVDSNPPVGLLVHTHYEHAGRVRITDVWDSLASFETFSRDRLQPAFEKVARAHGMDPTQMPQPEEDNIELHRVVRGTV